MNAGLAIMIAANGVLAVGHKDNSDNAGVIFVGLYMLLFAAILFSYEALQLCPFETLDLIYKKNFGFLYGVIGKSMFLLLYVRGKKYCSRDNRVATSVGIMAFGVGDYPSWSIGTGILSCSWAVAQILAYIWVSQINVFLEESAYFMRP